MAKSLYAYMPLYVKIGNPAFFLALYLTGVHFRSEFQHVGDVSKEKIKCRPIRTCKIGSVRLSEELYAYEQRGKRCQLEVYFVLAN